MVKGVIDGAQVVVNGTTTIGTVLENVLMVSGNEPLNLSHARAQIPTMIIFIPYFMLMKRWKMFFGAGTIYALFSVASIIWAKSLAPGFGDFINLLPTALALGVALDVFSLLLRPGTSTLRTALFAATVPIVMWSTYLYLTSTMFDIAWSTYFISAFPIQAAMLNVMLGLAVLTKPPQEVS